MGFREDTRGGSSRGVIERKDARTAQRTDRVRIYLVEHGGGIRAERFLRGDSTSSRSRIYWYKFPTLRQRSELHLEIPHGLVLLLDDRALEL
jgi:hypothetical protein